MDLPIDNRERLDNTSLGLLLLVLPFIAINLGNTIIGLPLTAAGVYLTVGIPLYRRLRRGTTADNRLVQVLKADPRLEEGMFLSAMRCRVEESGEVVPCGYVGCLPGEAWGGGPRAGGPRREGEGVAAVIVGVELGCEAEYEGGV
jgi:hypothetical protein